MENSSQRPEGERSSKKSILGTALALVIWIAFLWLLEVVDQLVLNGSLDAYGIQPRSVRGLAGIFIAPLLHGGFAHLASNTVPLVVLSVFVLFRGRSVFIVSTLAIVILAGFGTWLIGASDSVHIGASSLVFGYLGFLIGGGIFERSSKTVILAIVSAILYGGFVWGVMPGQSGISWEGHLFGFAGGILMARMVALRNRRKASLKSATGEHPGESIGH